MSKIQKFMSMINEELIGSQKYAEKYVTYLYLKPSWGKMYREMAEQELNHADYLRRMCEEFANNTSWISEEDRIAWDECVEHFSYMTGIIRAMLNI